MTIRSRAHRPLPISSSLAVTAALGALVVGAAPALADHGPGRGNGHGNAHGQHDEPATEPTEEETDGGDDTDDADGSGETDEGEAEPGDETETEVGDAEQAGKPEDGEEGDSGETGESGDDTEGDVEDPAGNNGTVKIAPYGEMDGIPQNTPHPGCSFQVEWYGFDEGEDIVSTVSFAMHAPTKDVELGVDGPTEVWVGEDPASGAGTATGPDGAQIYTLSFEGEPHAQQGYHLKLTVATPFSHGNDTKTKVFWVEPCQTVGTPEQAVADDTEVLGEQATADDGDDTEVLGAQATAADDEEIDVPSAVDAGKEAVVAAVSSPWAPLLAIGAGAVLTVGALGRRRAVDVRD